VPTIFQRSRRKIAVPEARQGFDEHNNRDIPTVWHDQAGFPDDTALMATAVFAGADLTAHIEHVLDELAAAESWESMALRFR
jgi:hypothetical protein